MSKKNRKISTEKSYKKSVQKTTEIGQVDICDISIDLKCRDEIPQLLFVLQAIYGIKQVRSAVFGILNDIIPEKVAADNVRSGMDLWKILVLGTIRINCNWEFDKVHDIVNNQKTVYEFVGHNIFDFDQCYGLQAIKDNLGFLTPDVIDRIN